MHQLFNKQTKTLIVGQGGTQANSNLDFHIVLFDILILFSEERKEQINNCWQVHSIAFQRGSTIMFSLCLWPHCVLLPDFIFEKRVYVGADTSIF